MYKLDLPIDFKEASAIERRRTREQQRQSRIFNAKTRLIGVRLNLTYLLLNYLSINYLFFNT